MASGSIWTCLFLGPLDHWILLVRLCYVVLYFWGAESLSRKLTRFSSVMSFYCELGEIKSSESKLSFEIGLCSLDFRGSISAVKGEGGSNSCC